MKNGWRMEDGGWMYGGWRKEDGRGWEGMEGVGGDRRMGGDRRGWKDGEG
jgi:hypothetical protein